MGKIAVLVVVALSLGCFSCSSPLLRTDLASFIDTGLSNNANLAGIAFTGAALTSGFAAGTPIYRLTGIGGPTLSFSATAVSGSQHLTYTWNGAAQTWASVGGVTFVSSSLTWVAGANTLQIVVMTPDRKTSKIYTFSNFTILNSTNIAASLADDLSGSYVLTQDIDTTATGNWTPVGSATSTPFTGTFDGAGHTITFKIPSYTNDGAGFFYEIGSGGLVKNLNVAGTVTSSSNLVGGIAGENTGTITGCTSAVNITATSSSETGGIAGASAGGTISYCISMGSVTGFYHTGGIVGVGNADDIDHCYTTGTISGTWGVGGIIGEWQHGTIDQCYSVATVTASSQNAGGLIGDVAGTGLACTDCYARGNVAGGYYVGGFIGGHYSGSATFTDCYATGSPTGTTVGYFVGSSSGSTFTSCYVANPAGGTFYLSTLSTAVPPGWNTAVWGQDASVNSAYPYLQYFGSNTKVP